MNTYVSLFAGAGGFDVGFDAAGFRCLAQVEIDRTARGVLARHWPDVPQFADVRNFGAEQVPYADVVAGGFPCQDVSTAGQRKGFEGGERSSLWFEMVRVVRELRPLCVVWENVPGLLSSDEGRAFGHVLRELADLGFDGGWRTVDAQFFGVPQQRRRVFGVFARGHLGAECCAEVLALREGVRRRTPPRRKKGKGTAPAAAGGAGGGGVYPSLRAGNPWNNSDPSQEERMLIVFGGGDTSGERGVAATLSAKGGTGRQDFDTENFVLTQVTPIDMRQASRGETMTNNRKPGTSGGAPGTGIGEPGDPCPTLANSHIPAVCFNWQSGGDCRLNPSELADAQSVGQTPAVQVGYTVRRLTPRECERLMGWPDDHTRWRGDGREVADGPRYRLCGNGVVGTVSKWLAKRLAAEMDALRKEAA